MKHIVFDARESGSTTGRYMDKLVEHMHKLKPNYRITLLTKKNRVEYLRQIAPDFEVVETPYEEFSFGEQFGFMRQIKSLNADLVHFPIVQQPILYFGKVVTTMQDLTTIRFRNPTKNMVVFWLKRQVYKALNIAVAHKSKALLAISETTMKDIARYCRVPESKFTVTLLSADPLAKKSEPYEPMRSKKFIMYTGRPLPHKNLGRLIEAFAILQKSSQPDLHLVLVGKKDAAYDLHVKTVQEKGIPNVTFTGFVSDEQLRWLYEHCAAYVFPSLSEGFGLPSLEAMLHGAPVVSSNASCLPEVNGKAAVYFNPLDTSDIATKIATVINDPTKRKQMISEGKKQAAKYSWERCAQQTLGVYEKALRD